MSARSPVSLPARCATGLLILLTAPSSEAQTRAVVARDSGATMQRLADGVYAILHDDATEDWPHGNAGVVVGRDGVLVIDSDYLPDRAAADIRLIRQVTPLPVRYLVNTHWHGDHTHGNGVYRDAFPGLAILGPRTSASFIALNQLKLPTGAAAPGSYNRRTLERLETLQTRGRDSTGRQLTAEERKTLALNIAQRRHEQTELAKVQVAPPNLIFEGALRLDLGNRTIEIRDMGVANSPADVIVYLPAERVLFTGDILVYPAPYATLSSPLPWIDVLRRLELYPVQALVPGHGPVMANHDYTRTVRTAFEMIRDQVDSLYRLGRNLQQAAEQVDIEVLRGRFLVPSGRPVRKSFWDEWTRNVAEQMASCLHGYRC